MHAKEINTSHNPDDNQLKSLELAATIVEACNNAKGKDIRVLDVAETFGLCDYFVIASGRSDRQVQGLCNKIIASLDQAKVTPVLIEGLDQAHWVLMDAGDVVVHIFYEPTREHYDLESLWVKARCIDIEEKLKSIKAARQAA